MGRLLTGALLVGLCYAPLRLEELHELKLFFNSTNGANWTDSKNW